MFAFTYFVENLLYMSYMHFSHSSILAGVVCSAKQAIFLSNCHNINNTSFCVKLHWLLCFSPQVENTENCWFHLKAE